MSERRIVWHCLFLDVHVICSIAQTIESSAQQSSKSWLIAWLHVVAGYRMGRSVSSNSALVSVHGRTSRTYPSLVAVGKFTVHDASAYTQHLTTLVFLSMEGLKLPSSSAARFR